MRFSTKDFAGKSGLAYDKQARTFWGCRDGFSVSVQHIPNRSVLVIRVYGKAGDEAACAPMLEAWKAPRTAVAAISCNGRALHVVAGIAARDGAGEAARLLDELLALAAELHLTPCCTVCGAETGAELWLLDGSGISLCAACVSRTEARMDEIVTEKQNEKPALAGLAIGMLAGAALVFALTYVVLLFSRLSFLTGFAGMYAALALMRKLGKKLTLPAVVCCAVLCLLGAGSASAVAMAKTYAEYNTELADDAAAYRDAYEALRLSLDGMTDDEQAALMQSSPEYAALDLPALEQRYREFLLVLDCQSQSDCLRRMGELVQTEIYREGGASMELTKCLLFGLVSILACACIISPPLLRESAGTHALRRPEGGSL